MSQKHEFPTHTKTSWRLCPQKCAITGALWTNKVPCKGLFPRVYTLDVPEHLPRHDQLNDACYLGTPEYIRFTLLNIPVVHLDERTRGTRLRLALPQNFSHCCGIGVNQQRTCRGAKTRGNIVPTA